MAGAAAASQHAAPASKRQRGDEKTVEEAGLDDKMTEADAERVAQLRVVGAGRLLPCVYEDMRTTLPRWSVVDNRHCFAGVVATLTQVTAA